jgi:5'-methylthioadenosine phosphorylase
MRYATVAVVVNYAAGRGDSADAIHLEQINAVIRTTMVKVRTLLEKLTGSDD